ncbi:prepilin-type N-terminal cleavage/methylation domain-containing protein [Luminiphilus syltensis]|uniref:prepilin-type N-terminal cleavage/methylation domain-containing protein n=1 Tax=Luminiphilus syltensis TaxID=1341119 RepID=UPI0002F27E63|nr:prepilin-type N-terminal cleavage/methylation domain-containing protein [Luminiphilus syltensis]
MTRSIRGFSLIELLVAVLIIVLLTSVVAFNVGSGGQPIEQRDRARLVASLMATALAESELTGADHGLLLTTADAVNGYQARATWLRRYDQGWAAPRTGADAFAEIVFAPTTELRISLEGQPDLGVADDGMRQPIPQIVFFAGGEVTPGQLDWVDRATGNLLYRLQWDLFGRSELLPGGERIEEES